GSANGGQDYCQDHYNASGVRSDYCDYWHFRVELTDDLKAFAEEHGGANSGADIYVTARLNRPAFGGTGAGGFTPGDSKDAQITSAMVDEGLGNHLATEYGFPMKPNDLQLTFAFWGNAAAPDLVKGDNNFRSFATHLRGGAYESDLQALTVARGLDWNYETAPRLNPSYTAPDHRSPFLAYYAQPVRPSLGGEIPTITPSFHRPSLFNALIQPMIPDASGNNWLSYLTVYRNAYANANVPDEFNVDSALVALMRKLTPRPLPLDHWKFDGGNDRLRYGVDGNVQNPEDLAQALASTNQAFDVDNDGDGFREGVWVSSGIPVRVDEHGTPYATMFSYTILDLDGRINVNAAGTWDQLPLNGENPYSSLADFAQEAYKEYGVDYFDGVSEDVVKGNSFSLRELFAWRNDRDVALRDGRTDDYPLDLEMRELIQTGEGIEEQARTLQRGDGFGVANVGLYDYFENALPNADPQFIEQVAESLLWRRYSDRLAGNRANNVVREDAGAGGLAGMQPGYRYRDVNGNEVAGENDDALNSKNVFFNLTNPMTIVNREDSNEDIIYPWRGKTTVSGNQEVPTVFDFANAALRS
ncbi:MAG: hypothetical protein IKY61_07075, partial [Thermoguttaceae bacterium]|nr:hypothetical protein [Thermoguttaceae bacterium]